MCTKTSKTLRLKRILQDKKKKWSTENLKSKRKCSISLLKRVPSWNRGASWCTWTFGRPEETDCGTVSIYKESWMNISALASVVQHAKPEAICLPSVRKNTVQGPPNWVRVISPPGPQDKRPCDIINAELHFPEQTFILQRSDASVWVSSEFWYIIPLTMKDWFCLCHQHLMKTVCNSRFGTILNTLYENFMKRVWSQWKRVWSWRVKSG